LHSKKKQKLGKQQRKSRNIESRKQKYINDEGFLFQLSAFCCLLFFGPVDHGGEYRDRFLTGLLIALHPVFWPPSTVGHSEYPDRVTPDEIGDVVRKNLQIDSPIALEPEAAATPDCLVSTKSPRALPP
jgi:hypothetical protein